jgi:hypothetical protein
MKIEIGKLIKDIFAAAAPVIAPIAATVVANAITKAGEQAKKTGT